MRESWVRGIFFKQVLDYIKRTRGETSLEMLNIKPEKYRIEERYDFEEFCKLLAKIDLMSAHDDGNYISKVARETMTEEATWKIQFRRMDPKNLLMSMKRQEGRHQIADFEATSNGGNLVLIKMSMWSGSRPHQDLWAHFYRGRLEGVLELMGRKGEVKMFKEFEDGVYTYEISWV